MFVDASALVAIIALEAERDLFIEMIAKAETPMWSAMSCWETVSSLCSSYVLPIQESQARVAETASAAGLEMVSIGEPQLHAALDAYKTYGKRSRHAARLNMGDCFAYACAKTNDAVLLYKGDDFTHTDLA